ncbi:MAG: hypothetical protein P794_09065 [Epsilonproteobacteria bacterium (ex Lamellibrachia satsuma)]|nr:MAG: hypothetical protein P794_09065 [Epsilonproteobacteria bacterium (ex Lamellibrachia satsuma)]
MYHLTYIDMRMNSELENELRQFFHRVRSIKRRLQQERSSLTLNRIQRNRCRNNLLNMESVENEFHAISHRDDVKVLYRKLQRYVKLDHERLMNTFGTEEFEGCSLFISF